MNREQRLAKNKKLKEIIKPDSRLLKACEELRYTVEHPNADSEIMLAQGVYKQKDPETIMTVTVDGVVIGYKVKPCSPLEMNAYFDRYVYVRFPGHKITDLNDKEIAGVKLACLEAFFEAQQGEIHVEVIGMGALLMWQRFAVTFPVRVSQSTIQVPQGFNG